MKYFVDCEFIEDGRTIDLISIGIVASDGREYYAISTEFNEAKASDWVRKNVLANLPPKYLNLSDPSISPRLKEEHKAWRSRQAIKEDLLILFAGGIPDSKAAQRLDWDKAIKGLEIWGEWCSYDWVAFCQIFGEMMDLPQGLPMRCRDIIQYSEDHLGIPSDRLPPSLETEGNHHALLGAKTVMTRYSWLKERESVRSLGLVRRDPIAP